MINKKLVLAIDFDGTIASLSYPEVGDLIPGAGIMIRKLHSEGHYIVINTCRTDEYQEIARQFLDKHLIPYHKINENIQELIDLYDMDSRKISADVYIDDKCLFDLPDWNEIYSIIQKKYTQALLAEVDEIEKRMDVIGQNGNTGEHYERDN
jgi:hypothetical protein